MLIAKLTINSKLFVIVKLHLVVNFSITQHLESFLTKPQNENLE